MDLTPHLSGDRAAAFHRAVLESAVLGILTIDVQGTILSANPAAVEMFGWPAEDLIGSHVRKLMPEPHASQHDDYVRRYLETGEKRIIGVGRAIQCLRSDGSLFEGELAISEIRVDDQCYFTGLIHDVTERVRAEEELRRHRDDLDALVAERTAELQKLTEELAESNRELDRFAAMVAHDLRNPLASMTMFLNVLRKLQGEQEDPESAHFLDLALKTSTRMKWLISELLDYSRMGGRDRAFETVDCNKLVAEVVADLEAPITDAGARVEVDPLPIVRGHQAELHQVFANLVQNALNYRGQRPAEVRIRAERDGTSWKFLVTDNGVGVPDESKESIFDPFERLHSYDEVQGHGLGLSICRKVVDYHGGAIGVVNAKGGGAEFWFTVPAAEDGD